MELMGWKGRTALLWASEEGRVERRLRELLRAGRAKAGTANRAAAPSPSTSPARRAS